MCDDAVVTLIQRHLRRYPQSHFHDVYKLLHQAALGPGHLISNKKKALEWIERDLDSAGPETPAPLAESIHPEGAMVRLHLHPYAAHGGDLRALRDAFARAAEQPASGADALAHWWDVFCRWAAEVCDDRFDVRELRLFGEAYRRQQWPAVHHSRAYEAAYRPAYRVLTLAEAEALCQSQRVPFEVV